ncbi:hypothetical protein P7C70_g6998, partial [Phenoliferia sp. Uapishka_3]
MGLATAQTLHKSGYSVALLDLFQASIDSAVATFPSPAPTSNHVWGGACDVSDANALETFFAEACKVLGGPIYGVAHCAGILGSIQPVHEQDWKDIEKIGTLVEFLGRFDVLILERMGFSGRQLHGYRQDGVASCKDVPKAGKCPGHGLFNRHVSLQDWNSAYIDRNIDPTSSVTGSDLS